MVTALGPTPTSAAMTSVQGAAQALLWETKTSRAVEQKALKPQLLSLLDTVKISHTMDN